MASNEYKGMYTVVVHFGDIPDIRCSYPMDTMAKWTKERYHQFKKKFSGIAGVDVRVMSENWDDITYQFE